MLNNITKSFDDCDCIVTTRKNLSAIKEGNFAAKLIYDIQVHENMKAFIRGEDPILHEVCHNIVTLQGKNALNDIMFHGATQVTTWYVLLFNTNTTCVNTMTYATPVFTESTDYGESTRPAYVEAASTSQIITNTANRAAFTMNASTTIYGCALVGGGSAANTKGDTAGGGILYSASLFADAKTVVDTNVLSVGISITQS